jgi:hypothetical protein
MRRWAWLGCFAWLIAGCGGDDEDKNQDPAGADQLWARIHQESYRTWERAPGYEQRRESSAPHGDHVDIYVNETLAGALAGPPLTSWPVGSLVVKDGFRGTDPYLVAAMEKRADGWYYAEWSASGGAKYSGRPSLCTGCHVQGQDNLRAFPLP